MLAMLALLEVSNGLTIADGGMLSSESEIGEMGLSNVLDVGLLTLRGAT